MAYPGHLVLLGYPENPDLQESRGVQDLREGSVYLEPKGQEEILGLRASPEQKDLLERMDCWGRGAKEVTQALRVWLVLWVLLVRMALWE